MNSSSSHLHSLAAAASSSQGSYDPRYTQMLTYGTDVNNNPIRVSLVKLSDPTIVGTPYINTAQNNEWGSDIALPNPEGLTFTGVSAVTGYNNTSYIMLLSSEGNIGIIYQETGNQNWRWWGEMKDPGGNTFNWITTGTGDFNNLQVVLLKSDQTPHLLWQDNGNGSWAWGNLDNGGKTFQNVQLGKGNGGNLQAVLTGTDGLPYLIWQDQAGDAIGTWNWYGQLPTDGNTDFVQVQSAIGVYNDLQNVFIDTKNNNLYLIWQDNGSGAWYWGHRLPLNQDVFKGSIAFYTFAAGTGNISLIVYVGEASAEGGYDVYDITLDNSGTWAWGGFVEHINAVVGQTAVADLD